MDKQNLNNTTNQDQKKGEKKINMVKHTQQINNNYRTN